MLTLNQTLYINNVPAKGKFFFYMLYGAQERFILKLYKYNACIMLCIHVTSMPCAYIYICQQEQKIVIFVTQNKM